MTASRTSFQKKYERFYLKEFRYIFDNDRISAKMRQLSSFSMSIISNATGKRFPFTSMIMRKIP